MFALVTGGGGFLGRYIVEQLLSRGDRVRSFSRGAYPELEQQGAEVVCGDIRDAESVHAACEGVDTVFHVAAIPGIWGKWETYHAINTLGTQHVLDGCAKHGVKRLIYTSSPSVVYDGKPHVDADESLPYPDSYLCHYPHSKAIAERAVLAANSESLRTVSLRPHLIWGPRDNHLIPRLIQRAMAGKLMRVGDGSNIVSMSYVENAATAHLQACDALDSGACAGKAYFINEPEPVVLWDWVNELLALGDLPPIKRSVSPGFARSAGAVLEGIYWTFGIQSEPRMTRFLASQLSQSHSYRIEAAQRDFGFAPAVSYEEGMLRIKPEIIAQVERLNGS